MAKKIRISEAQYKQILKEGIAVNLPVTDDNNVDKNALQNIKNQMNGKDVTLTADLDNLLGASGNTPTKISESHDRLITKKELQSNRLRYLKENSEVLSLNNFMKRLH